MITINVKIEDGDSNLTDKQSKTFLVDEKNYDKIGKRHVIEVVKKYLEEVLYMEKRDNKHSDEVDPLDLLIGESRERWKKIFGTKKC